MAETRWRRFFPGPAEQIELSKKMVNDSRVQIDTLSPFGSVQEAIDYFEGLCKLWIPLHMLRQQQSRPEEEAAMLEKELTAKEQETLQVLKGLESAKRILEDLKSRIRKEVYECSPTPNFVSVESSTPNRFILMELKEAKSNLRRATNDLAAIRASVESLTDKMMKQKPSAEISIYKNPPRKLNREEMNKVRMHGNSANHLTNISSELQQLNLAAEQFIKVAEASKCEVLRAMSEIEDIKSRMKAAEMRWIAAKKMEEAARAVEAVALAEMETIGDSNPNNHELALSLEDYLSITHRGPQTHPDNAKHEFESNRIILEEALNGVESARSRNHRATNSISSPRLLKSSRESKPVLRSPNSQKDVPSRKPDLRNYSAMRNQHEKEHVDRSKVPSLSEMLGLQREVLSASSTGDTNHGINNHRQFTAQKKKFSLIHIALPLSKHGRKKMQSSNP